MTILDYIDKHPFWTLAYLIVFLLFADSMVHAMFRRKSKP
jgi:hypothetical protein